MALLAVAALYHFGRLEHLETLQSRLHELLTQHYLRGTLLIAEEGINGTIAGERPLLEQCLTEIRSVTGFTDLEVKWSHATRQPFGRTKVRIRPEIVTLGASRSSPHDGVGTYVEAGDWDALIADPTVLLIDARNDYEVRIGSFPRALNPKTQSFRELPDFLERTVGNHPEQRVAMFCTGGIRCEKASAYLKQRGFSEVFHLKGGILKYLEHIPAETSSFRGDCFVFDERVAVGNGLVERDVVLCAGCGQPLTVGNRAHPAYIEGECCEFCALRRAQELKSQKPTVTRFIAITLRAFRRPQASHTLCVPGARVCQQTRRMPGRRHQKRRHLCSRRPR
jgi:UPF0176 protein